MPYHRTVRYASSLLAWHELVLEESVPEWSRAYRAESPRLLVPGTRWIEAEQRGRRFVCDALTPLVLTPEVPYRMRQPFVGQRSVVIVVEGGGAGALPGACRLRFGPAAQWRLARCRAMLAWGASDRLGFEEDVLALLHDAAAAGADSIDGAAAPTGRDRDVDPSAARAVERARELLASEPSWSGSLGDIAQAVAASPFHLARRFKRTNGVGLHGYRTRLRMALALARLSDGESDLCGLAIDLGYSSHSHFTAAFRARFGCPPSRARELLAHRARIR